VGLQQAYIVPTEDRIKGVLNPGTMAKERVEQLWEVAQAGTRKLSASERRRVLIYLDEVGEKKQTNYDLARIFKVSEAQIRADKQRLLGHYVRVLTPEAAISLVAGHFRELDNMIALCKRGMDACDSGTTMERFYLETMAKLLRERFTSWQEVGVVRKELGNLNVTEERWVATVSPAGECGVHKEDPGKSE
jgi:hypothetical protein